MDALKFEIERHGGRATIVPIGRLQDIQQDIQNLRDSGLLNRFQQHIVTNMYSLDLPETDFEVRSLVMVASPSPGSAPITLTWNGKRFSSLIPAGYVDNSIMPARIEAELNAFLNPQGYHVRHAPRLPHKLLAVRSGLGMYGRNNICYVEGMGSLLNLAPYVSDLPCTEEGWYEIRHMDLCATCRACLNSCPTAAITPDRFLLDNERCLTYFNEAGSEWNFPAWLDPAAHHTLYGCLRCQAACPVNKPYVDKTTEPTEFTEEEMALLLEGKAFELLPETLKKKVSALDMAYYLGALPRNLRALFDKEHLE